MTEMDWQAGGNPEAMLNFLGPSADPRKLRLFAVACCRRIWPLIPHADSRRAVDVAERFAEGQATAEEMNRVRHFAAAQAGVHGDPLSVYTRHEEPAAGAAWATTRPSAWVAAWDTAWEARLAARDGFTATNWELERERQASQLRELFGNPFRPPFIDPVWLAVSDGAVFHLARTIHADGRHGDLPILADALEEAGCLNQEVLTHCRQRGWHTRGCWVVDALLAAGRSLRREQVEAAAS